MNITSKELHRIFTIKQIVDGFNAHSENRLMEAVDILIDMSERSIWENERGSFIKVIVKPNSRSKEFVSEMTPEAVHLNLTGPAREGKANAELVKRMAKTLGVTTGSITIIAGHRSREKTLLVTDMTREAAIQKLSEAI